MVKTRLYPTTGDLYDFKQLELGPPFWLWQKSLHVSQCFLGEICQSKDKAIFSPNSFRSMDETGFTGLKTSPKAVAQPTLSCLECISIYISLVSHIFDFGLWPIRPRHGYFDLSRKKRKTGWNAFELGFAVWKLVTLKWKNGAGDFSRPSGDFSRLKGDFTRPTCFIHYFPLGPGHVPVEAHPRPNSNMFMSEQTRAIAASGCVTAEDRHMK